MYRVITSSYIAISLSVYSVFVQVYEYIYIVELLHTYYPVYTTTIYIINYYYNFPFTRGVYHDMPQWKMLIIYVQTVVADFVHTHVNISVQPII